MLLKGDFRRASFARLPVVGAYEDWKDCVPSSSEDGVADPFRMALNLLKEVLYTNSATEKSIRPLRVISVQWSHLEQTLQINERLEHTVMAEPRRLRLCETKDELRAQGLNVTLTKPHFVTGFCSRKYCDTCLLVSRSPFSKRLDWPGLLVIISYAWRDLLKTTKDCKSIFSTSGSASWRSMSFPRSPMHLDRQ